MGVMVGWVTGTPALAPPMRLPHTSHTSPSDRDMGTQWELPPPQSLSPRPGLGQPEAFPDQRRGAEHPVSVATGCLPAAGASRSRQRAVGDRRCGGIQPGARDGEGAPGMDAASHGDGCAPRSPPAPPGPSCCDSGGGCPREVPWLAPPGLSSHPLPSTAPLAYLISLLFLLKGGPHRSEPHCFPWTFPKASL